MSSRSGAGRRLSRLRVEVDRAAVEPVLEQLAAAGCTGTWQRPSGGDGSSFSQLDEDETDAGTALIDAWFPTDWLPAGDAAGELERRLESLGARSFSWEPAEERDWLEDYRRIAQPILVGDFELDPREPESVTGEADLESPLQRLSLPARSAFGTGSHETTRLVVEALQELDLEDRSVLDVGTGTGVLGFVARRLGAASVLGFDLDPVAVVLAAENARRNRVGVSLFAGTIEALAPDERFDVVLVNVLPENLAGSEPEIARSVARDGDLLVSGLLSERAAEIEERWRRLGLERVADRALGEWTLLHLRTGG